MNTNELINEYMKEHKCSRSTAFRRHRRLTLNDTKPVFSVKNDTKPVSNDTKKVDTNDNDTKTDDTNEKKCKCCEKKVGDLICMCHDCVDAGKKHDDYCDCIEPEKKEFIPNWKKSGHKSKDDAIAHIIGELRTSNARVKAKAMKGAVIAYGGAMISI